MIDILRLFCQVLGGRVEAKVPRQGYILIQPGTPEAERLRLCWSSLDRPDRHFVPYTYVEACKVAGMLLKQIFVENGVPIKMHIHSMIANPNARTALAQRIMVSIFIVSPCCRFTCPMGLAFRWRPNRFDAISPRYLGRSKYGRIPTSRQGQPRHPR